jgi:hypothetical protein
LGTSAWQPNERIVGLFDIHKGQKRGDWHLSFEALTTTQRTIHLKGTHRVDGNRPLQKLTYSSAKGLAAQAVAMAKSSLSVVRVSLSPRQFQMHGVSHER